MNNKKKSYWEDHTSLNKTQETEMENNVVGKGTWTVPEATNE
jgi:hypothetical protein